jgi:hemolysin activation/secretion protein
MSLNNKFVLVLLLLSVETVHAQATGASTSGATTVESSQAAIISAPTQYPSVDFCVIPDAGANDVRVIRPIVKILGDLGEYPVDRQDVQKWSDRLSAALRQGGFPIGQVFMTEEDWKNAPHTGRYVFLVVPGRISGIDVKNTSRVSDARLQRVITEALCDVAVLGEDRMCLLESSRLERTTQLLQDIPGVAIAGAPKFSAGQQQFTTQVEFDLEEKGKPVQGGILLDNNGIAATGRARAGINVAGNNLFHAGDAYGFTLMDTRKHMRTGMASASTPLGYSGLRLAGSITRQQFTTNSVTPIAGVSTVTQAGLQYPLTRGLDSNVWSSLWFLHNQSKVTYTDFDWGTRSTMNALQFSIQADNGDRAVQLRTDRWSTQTTLTLGHNSSTDPSNRVTQRTGNYMKLSGQVFGSYGLSRSGDLFVTGRIVGQLANRNLDGSEQLAMGGPYAVRAYRADEGSVDEGAVVNMGLYYRFPLATGHQLQVGGIVDTSYGYVNHSPWDGWNLSYVGVSGVKNSRRLSGYGLSTDWLTPWGVMLSFTVARPFGFSPTSWVDPGKTPNQYWLAATWSRW